MVVKLAGALVFAVVAIGAFLLSLAVGVIGFMVAIGGGILALLTFGVLDYRKSKRTEPPP